jgi:hypothetical protein
LVCGVLRDALRARPYNAVTLGRDPETARLLNRIGYAATMRRIEREGV